MSKIEGKKGKNIFKGKVWVDHPLASKLRFGKRSLFLEKPNDYKPIYPCAIKLTFHIVSIDRCDLDNLVKATIDFLNNEGFLKHDDTDVFYLEAEKKEHAFSDTQHFEVEINEWIPES